ncbi:unnamed protein product [Linum tenue]|uniref:Uncharacterized protein n=1 Tax=Linum tenue TaxID=586396 RepID=A0AAV0H4N6_9ROSI|nr:unnamed protein product [Linum tenue]
MLVFMGCAAALTDRVQKLTIVGVAIVWGFVLMAAIYAVGHISGGHFNPAVTVALATIRRFRWKEVPMYVLAQLLGATLASLTLRGLFHKQADIDPIMTQYVAPTSDLVAFTWEFIITFTLMFSICANATDDRAVRTYDLICVPCLVMQVIDLINDGIKKTKIQKSARCINVI